MNNKSQFDQIISNEVSKAGTSTNEKTSLYSTPEKKKILSNEDQRTPEKVSRPMVERQINFNPCKINNPVIAQDIEIKHTSILPSSRYNDYPSSLPYDQKFKAIQEKNEVFVTQKCHFLGFL